MPRSKYATVKIPEELAEALDACSRAWGYRSRAEVVDDAIRLYILRMKEYGREGTAVGPRSS
jgi:metal-responsive CopG/Arc/MetJ family transcriptional regulator